MREQDPKMPKTQTSAPVSREKPRDVREEREDKTREADAGGGATPREDAAGGDRGIME